MNKNNDNGKKPPSTPPPPSAAATAEEEAEDVTGASSSSTNAERRQRSSALNDKKKKQTISKNTNKNSGVQLAPGVVATKSDGGDDGDTQGLMSTSRTNSKDDDNIVDEPQGALDAFVVQEIDPETLVMTAEDKESRKLAALKVLSQDAPLVEGVVTTNKTTATGVVEEEQRKRNLCLLGSLLFILILGVIIVPLAGLGKLPYDSRTNQNTNNNEEEEKDVNSTTVVPSDAEEDNDNSTTTTITMFPSDYPSGLPSFVPTMVPTTPAPTSNRFASIVNILFPNSDDDDDQRPPRNPSSPQWKALQWLADEDSSNVTNLPEESMWSRERLIQRYALATLYFATNGETWTHQFNFLSDRHECEWQGNNTAEKLGGVSCLTNSTIPFVILLDNNNLIGTLPDELGLLTAMERMDFQLNPGLTGTIPSSIESMEGLLALQLFNCNLNGMIPWSAFSSSLVFLFLESNLLTGTIPTVLDNLKNLTDLKLEDNYLTGTIPSALFSLPTMQWLNLYYNIFDGSLPDFPATGGLESMLYLNVAQNLFTGTIPESIGNLESIMLLDLGVNSFTGSLPNSLTKLQTLLQITVHLNDLTGPLPFVNGSNPSLELFLGNQNSLSGSLEPLGYLQGLKVVNVGAYAGEIGNNFTGSIPTSLCALPIIRTLGFGENFLTGTLPECIGRLGNTLTQFGVRNNGLVGTLPAGFQNLTALSTLDLSYNKFTSTIPDWIGDLSSLGRFVFSYNNFVGTLPQSFSLLSNLLLLAGQNNNFTGPLPEFGAAPNLRSIAFPDNRLTGTVPASFQNLTALTDLYLQRNLLTGDLSFLCNTDIAFEIFVADCYNRTDLGIEILCPCCDTCCDEAPENGCEFNSNQE